VGLNSFLPFQYNKNASFFFIFSKNNWTNPSYHVANGYFFGNWSDNRLVDHIEKGHVELLILDAAEEVLVSGV
jgi:hypothetical protein